MCGIAFRFSRDLSQADLHRLMADSIRRLAHRGPDDSHLVSGTQWAMGHRRLSIIDLAGGRQPMADPTERYWLIFNGQIYNYKGLRSELVRKWHFRTNSDTEVLLAGIAVNGAEFLEKLHGMWAFALWDSARSVLLIARDRSGKKPLYFFEDHDGLSVASELKALESLSGREFAEDDNSTADYLRYGFYLPGKTAFRGVCELKAGHWAEWKPSTVVRQQSYWTPDLTPYNGTQREAAEDLRESIGSAVDLRLVSDVEVGALLSGGIDSSLVATMAAPGLEYPIRTFTVGFPGDHTYDETKFAREVAEHIGSQHHEDFIENLSQEDLRRLITEHVGQPFADASLLPTHLACKLAAKHVKVALSGDGADELFCGYQRYQGRILIDWYEHLPLAVRQSIGWLIDRLPEPHGHHSRSLLKKAKLFRRMADRESREPGPYIAPPCFTETALEAAAPDLTGKGHPPDYVHAPDVEDEVHRMMVQDFFVYLAQDILQKVDRASMASSLEVRAPLLDSRVIELALSFPRRWHRRGTSGKRMLFAAFGDKLPTSIWRRRKQGFAVPLGRWFQNGLSDELIGLMKSVSNPFDRNHLEALIREHNKGADHGQLLWTIYVYLVWKAQRRRSAP